MKQFAIAALAAISLAGCAISFDDSSPDPTATANTAAPAQAFSVTSADFADGDELADWATANAYGGQCVGDNLNPALAWTNVPEGTKAFAITLIDTSANNYIHWLQFDIPADVTSIDRGAEASDGGIEGTTNEDPGYFGPCPPDADHVYVFTVYALDAPVGLEDGARYAQVKPVIDEHTLATATITGTRSGPA